MSHIPKQKFKKRRQGSTLGVQTGGQTHRPSTALSRAPTVVSLLALVTLTAGCSKFWQRLTHGSAPTPNNSYQPAENYEGGITIAAGLPKLLQGSTTLEHPGGGFIPVRVFNGHQHILVQGTLSPEGFSTLLAQTSTLGGAPAERTRYFKETLQTELRKINTHAKLINPTLLPEVGYFSAWVAYDQYENLRSVRGLSHSFLMDPVVVARMDERTVRKMAAELGPGGVSLNGQGNFDEMSGLKSMGVPEFVDAVEQELATRVNGDQVKVGITDTGITFNHPAFTDATGKSRIVYMKDFSGEGRVFFNPAAAFEVTIPNASEIPEGAAAAAVLLLTAEYLEAVKGAGASPVADTFSRIERKAILVSPELRTLLTTAGNGARLGVISEAAFENADAGETVDINANGKTDDLLWVISIPGDTPELTKLYVDTSGKGDFRTSKAVGDFNQTKQTWLSFSEKIGFDIKQVEITNSAQQPVSVLTASIVGFDPGNHGSHVAGIVGGRKTISNDRDDTLARGVAPAVNIMANRVCANNGGCNATEAIIDLAKNGAEIINMSLGGLSPYNDGYGVEETIINRLTQLYNTLFIISAGNSGPGRNTIGSPSTARLALSVGATASRAMINRQYQWAGYGKPLVLLNADTDFMLFFSSRGPTAAGGFKPNISAPGTELSSVQLNASPGGRPGLDVYWGTSMAAPAAAGAAALLLDAAKKFNLNHSENPLPLDALTLRRVLMESARPFDVTQFNPVSGATLRGQYTWIDQGAGMVNLPQAWSALKQARDARAPAAINMDRNPGDDRTGKTPVQLDYEVRVLRKNPNGLDYTGAGEPVEVPVGLDPQGEKKLVPRLGNGIWLDHAGKDSLVEVQIARRLPERLLARSDVGELQRLLNTSADHFKLETTIHGSTANWLSAGSLQELDCNINQATPSIDILGPGAVDLPTGSLGFRPSSLFVCVNRATLNALPPGDHGALIKAYRQANGVREKNASFIIPVYVTIPHRTLAGQARYEVNSSVQSFAVDRNYIDVPKGTSLVRVSLEVPAAKETGTSVKGCAGVELMVLEGANTAVPAELSPRSKAIANNCDGTGVPTLPTKRRVAYERVNPKPGVWDMHVFGRYQFSNSPYTLKVDYARITTTVESVAGGTDKLNGSFVLKVVDSSFEVIPAQETSTYSLTGIRQETQPTIKQDENLQVPDASGVVARQYPATVANVTFTTGGASKSDLDLTVLECKDAALTQCDTAATSGGATDVESASVQPKPDLFYVAVVNGYDVDQGDSTFAFTETQNFAQDDKGTLSIVQTAANQYDVAYSLDVATSTILANPNVVSGLYKAIGAITIRSAENSTLAVVPVEVSGAPSPVPSPVPTFMPMPSPVPSIGPVPSPVPTVVITAAPTVTPAPEPTVGPTPSPTRVPPDPEPTVLPTALPTTGPTAEPTTQPSSAGF